MSPQRRPRELHDFYGHSHYRDYPSDDDEKRDLTDTSSSSTVNEADAIRLKAFDLLNRLGPDAGDDETTWPEKPKPTTPPAMKISNSSSYNNSNNNHHHTHYGSLEPGVMAPSIHENKYQKEFGLAGLMVSCIAVACQKSSEYVLSSTTRRPPEEEEKVSILNTYQSRATY